MRNLRGWFLPRLVFNITCQKTLALGKLITLVISIKNWIFTYATVIFR